MVWYAWALVVLIVVNSLANIAAIGRPRKPISTGDAIAVLVINGLMVWAVVALAT